MYKFFLLKTLFYDVVTITILLVGIVSIMKYIIYKKNKIPDTKNIKSNAIAGIFLIGFSVLSFFYLCKDLSLDAYDVIKGNPQIETVDGSVISVRADKSRHGSGYYLNMKDNSTNKDVEFKIQYNEFKMQKGEVVKVEYLSRSKYVVKYTLTRP